MPAFLFYFFAFLAILGALGVVLNRNPVSSAMSMIVSFLGVAALFVGLNAYFIGIIQILVYAGAIMVLFLFIIMLLDLKSESVKSFGPVKVGLGAGVAVVFVGIVWKVLNQFEQGEEKMPPMAAGEVNDVMEIGERLFTSFNFPLQVMGVLLLVATVGVVVLSKRGLN